MWRLIGDGKLRRESTTFAGSQIDTRILMLLDPGGHDSVSPADICIVGAGPVGLALAFSCAEGGLTVTLVDSGDFGRKPGGQGLFGSLDITTEHHANLKLTSHRGIGGASRLWGGRCVMLDDIDFEQRPHVPFSGWPITHGEIARHYRGALDFLGFGKSASEPPMAAVHGEASADLVEQWSPEPDLARFQGGRLRASPRIRTYSGCTVTQIRLDPEGRQVAGLSANWRGRTVEFNAKAYVLAAGGLENARLLLATQRAWPEKFGGPDGALGRFYTGHLTGYLATIQFAQPGFARKLWYQKRGDGSHVRRRLALTPEAQRRRRVLNTAFWLESFSVSDPAHGSGALSMIYVGLALMRLYPHLGRGLAPSATEPEWRGYREHLLNIRHDPQLLASTVRVLSQLMLQPFRRRAFAVVNPRDRYLLRYHAEQRPNPDNRVTLSGQQDGSPLPRLRVDYRFLPEDATSVVESHAVLERSLQHAGIGRLDYLAEPDRRIDRVLKQALDGYHQIGLTRMSADPRDGVVDRNCRVHDLANLYVVGSSVFPTAGQANPTLPAVALALRLADHLQRTMAFVPDVF